MSSRVLRKLQSEKEKDLGEHENLSDLEVEPPVGGVRKKQLNINRYDLLNEQSHSESEVKEDDNETEANKSYNGDVQESIKKRRKKRKKKSGKQTNTHRSSEDNAEVDEVERSLKEVNRLLGESPHIVLATSQKRQDRSTHRKTVLSVQHRHLNPNNELKRIFGSKVIQGEHKRKNRGGASRPHTKNTWMVTCKENWPQVGKSGLSMALLETCGCVHYFAYEHSQNYRQVENRFLQAVESSDPDNIVSIINEHPYHVNALIQMSDLCKLSEDLSMAAELIQRALYFQEFAFHPLFNVAQGNCRLDYKRQENRPFFITLFKHLTFLGGRACCRTSLEFCKVLLSLDPQGDPLAIKLAMDFYALRAKEYQWLVDLVDEMEAFNLMQLPNFSYSVPVAYFYLGESGKADQFLQDALLMFPHVLTPLLNKCSIQIDNRVANHSYFQEPTEKNVPTGLLPLVLLYVNRNYHIWKDADLLPWLEKNVHEVLDRVDRKDPAVEDCREKRLRRYSRPLPLSIGRHLILSDDAKGVPFTDSSEAIMSFDPLPPKDSINSYTRPKRPTVASSSSHPLQLFLGSLLPDFNPNQPIDLGQGQVDQAQAVERADNNSDFPRSLASLVDAIRDLFNNIRPELQQQNDADDDADDGDSQDDDLS